MNKGALISAVATAAELKQADAKDLIEKFSEVVKAALVAGDEVTLPGIGKLKVSTRAARAGRNPKTGEAIQIEAKRVVKFAPSSEFEGSLAKV